MYEFLNSSKDETDEEIKTQVLVENAGNFRETLKTAQYVFNFMGTLRDTMAKAKLRKKFSNETCPNCLEQQTNARRESGGH